jgi:molecular chaperone GrpE
MSEESHGNRPGNGAYDDDVEILEVVGVDESGVEPAAPDAAEGEEVEVVFEQPPKRGDAAAERDLSESPAGPQDPVVRERFLRLQADFENLRKRTDRERDEHVRHATSALVARLLPVLDNFERAIAAGRMPGGVEALLEGVELVQRQLLDELQREGLRIIEAQGSHFDPGVHDAVATDASSGLPANIVVEEMRRGYYFHDRVLRPSLVRVSVDAADQAGPDDVREE